jgi:hypothetical protein
MPPDSKSDTDIPDSADQKAENPSHRHARVAGSEQRNQSTNREERRKKLLHLQFLSCLFNRLNLATLCLRSTPAR